MNCWKCGAEVPPGGRFCPGCGADLQQAPPSEEPAPPEPQAPPSGGRPPVEPVDPVTPGGSSAASGGPGGPAAPGGPGIWDPNGGNENVLKIFSLVCAVVYGVMAVRGLIAFIRTLFGIPFNLYASYILFSVPNLIFGLLGIVLDVCLALVLVMVALKRTPENSDGLLLLAGIGGVGTILVKILRPLVLLLFNALFLHSYLSFDGYLSGLALTILGAVVVVGGIYAIRRFLLGEMPLLGKTPDELRQEVGETLGGLGQTANEAAQGAKSSWDASRQARQQQQAQQQARWQAQQQTQWQPQPGQWQGQPGQPTPPPTGYAAFRLKNNRSLLAYIVLTIITCGIYGWYFIYALARDVNVACAGDGKKTAGLIKLILLSFITCGIYSFIWYYSLGNRLAANAPRYGLSFQENGTTVLLWLVLGSLLCGIGPFVALHIIIKNTNTICGAYNYQHGI